MLYFIWSPLLPCGMIIFIPAYRGDKLQNQTLSDLPEVLAGGTVGDQVGVLGPQPALISTPPATPDSHMTSLGF